jgi:hypothetical protein
MRKAYEDRQVAEKMKFDTESMRNPMMAEWARRLYRISTLIFPEPRYYQGYASRYRTNQN